MSDQPAIQRDAGVFSEWLAAMRTSLRSDVGTDVPCGDCVGCCVSSYYIPVRPRDAQARARIPDDFIVIGSNQPAGHFMIRYLDDGTCPMLQAGKCRIYEHRPQTCRDYDCRIFAAAGLDAGGPERAVINRRVHEWVFRYPSAADREAHDAVLMAARFIREHPEAFPGRRAPATPSGIAVLAVKAYGVFLDASHSQLDPPAVAQAIIAATLKFDTSEAQCGP